MWRINPTRRCTTHPTFAAAAAAVTLLLTWQRSVPVVVTFWLEHPVAWMT
jgi:hypothetical protein